MFFMIVLPSSGNLVILYICLEGVALMAYMLAASEKTGNSGEAGMKYFLQSSVVTAFLLMGMSYLFTSTHQFSFSGMVVQIYEGGASEQVLVGVTMLVVALLFKVGSFPASFWKPDVYQGTPLLIINFFAVTITGSAFIAMFLVYKSLLLVVWPNFDMVV